MHWTEGIIPFEKEAITFSRKRAELRKLYIYIVGSNEYQKNTTLQNLLRVLISFAQYLKYGYDV